MKAPATRPKDVCDVHLQAGHNAVLGMLDNVVELPADRVKVYSVNDAGRAERFVDSYGSDLRYVPAWSRWLIWAEHYWRPDDDNAVTRMAIEHSKTLLRQAAEIEVENTRAAAVKEAVTMGDSQRIRQMLELAKCDTRVIAHHLRLDANPFLLGVRNGVVDLRTGAFRPGEREDLITKRAGTACEPAAECPRWRTFLTEVLAGDEKLVEYVQKFVGYSLTGDMREQCFPFLFGSGKNGKSVFTETLQRLFGDYGQRASQSLLTQSINGRDPSQEIARLQGARLVVGSETEEGAKLAENRVKDLTGGDTITGRYLYAEAFDFQPVLKLWVFGNHKPEVRGTDDGIWRRIRLIPFTVAFPEERRDRQLGEKLHAELAGILQWAVEGTRLWLRDGLKAPVIVTEASSEYRVEQDTLGEFLADETVEDAYKTTSLSEMFTRYQQWATRTGVRRQLTQGQLTRRLKERGLQQQRTETSRYWDGIGLT